MCTRFGCAGNLTRFQPDVDVRGVGHDLPGMLYEAWPAADVTQVFKSVGHEAAQAPGTYGIYGHAVLSWGQKCSPCLSPKAVRTRTQMVCSKGPKKRPNNPPKLAYVVIFGPSSLWPFSSRYKSRKAFWMAFSVGVRRPWKRGPCMNSARNSSAS